MHAKVDENCIGCGLCAATCPAVFSMEDTMAVAVEGAIPAADVSDAERARDDCPVNAIQLSAE